MSINSTFKSKNNNTDISEYLLVIFAVFCYSYPEQKCTGTLVLTVFSERSTTALATPHVCDVLKYLAHHGWHCGLVTAANWLTCTILGLADHADHNASFVCVQPLCPWVMSWVSVKRWYPQSAQAAGAEELGQIWHTSEPMLTLTYIIVSQSRGGKSQLQMHRSHLRGPWHKMLVIWAVINNWTGGCYPKRSSCSAWLWEVTWKTCCNGCQKFSRLQWVWNSGQRGNHIFICWRRNRSVRASKQSSLKMNNVNCLYDSKNAWYHTFVSY